MSFYHSYIILSSWSHSVVLMLFYHSNIISSSWSHSIVLMSFYRSEVIQLTRGCSGTVYWNKGVSNSTRGCSNIQVQNNPVLNFVWLLFEFHQSHIILSFWCHFIILISIYHLEVIPSFWCYSIILISFHHPEAIPLFWCHSIILKSFYREAEGSSYRLFNLTRFSNSIDKLWHQSFRPHSSFLCRFGMTERLKNEKKQWCAFVW